MLTTNPIKIIGASAGTGKTTRLANQFVAAITGAAYGKKIEANRILVSTFTNRAANELTARIRQRLIQEGDAISAQLLLSGYIGTVNSICGKILVDHALEAGLSPIQNVIPDDTEDIIFSIAVDPVIDTYSDRIDEIAVRLGFDEPPRRSVYAESIHWSQFVKQICNLARANRVMPAAFAECARRSWEGLKPYLRQPKPGQSADELDEKLLKELDRTITSLERANDSTKKTQDTLQLLKEIHLRSRRRPLSWSDWANLARTEVSKSSNIMTIGLVNTATSHPAHPRLHNDLQQFIELIFECAAEASIAYQGYKAAAGLVDFVDQECLALDLLADPKVAESLKARISLALIDEFQDTSPIQLALFLKLAELCEKSVWVGDSKQAIYGFRGTDPELMQAIINSVQLESMEFLRHSYRSKPHLVEFSNDLFTQAMAAFGFDPETIRVESKRDEQSQADQPVLQIWRCDGQKLEECYASFALSVEDLLACDQEIFDKLTKKNRRLLGSDVAILCRSNDRCEGLAEALSRAGIEVAMTRDGLLDTPECLLTLAVLKYLVDKRDSLALAQIVHLTGNYENSTQAEWLQKWLANADNPHQFIESEVFDHVRAELPTCTALEALQHAITVGQVLEVACSWGNVAQRTANIDSLRGLAMEYESTCSMEKSAASAAGFISFIEHLKDAKQPPSTSSNAVQIMTYHGAKGLEWPIVILTDLDKGAKPEVHRDLCRVVVHSDSDALDAADPLKGRWIRFWPWPYGRQEQNVHLDTSLLKSPEYEATSNRIRAENARLLYVGITRARDLLILAPYVGRRGQSTGLEWLQELKDTNKRTVLKLPFDDGVHSVTIGDSQHIFALKNVSSFAQETATSTVEAEALYLQPQKERAQFPNLLLRPSAVTTETTVDASTLPIYDIGERVPLTGSPDMQQLGDCVHNFLAADNRGLSFEERLQIADRVRLLWTIPQLTSESMLEMSDRLAAFILEKFGACAWLPECPLSGRIDNQRVHGQIDLLLETANSFTILDHKTFPGAPEHWPLKALSFAGQLTTYAAVLKQSVNKPITGLLVHMPVVGKIVDLSQLLLL